MRLKLRKEPVKDKTLQFCSETPGAILLLIMTGAIMGIPDTEPAA
jgi:hypothetical protein